MASLSNTSSPSKLLTFLFTDIESSTRLWEKFPDAMKGALERHDTLLRTAVEGSNGKIVKTTGDGLLAVFTNANEGINAGYDYPVARPANLAHYVDVSRLRDQKNLVIRGMV